MLSLPLILPHDDHSIWRCSSSHLQTGSPPPSTDTLPPSHASEDANAPAHHRLQRRSQTPRSSALAALLLDEKMIEQRKLNVRRFGAGWIRPPGIAKTYQATMDEDYERADQELQARHERDIVALANAQEQQEEQARQRSMIERGLAEERAAAGQPDDGTEEVDLDAEVPDMDAEIPEGGLGGSSDEDDEDDEDDDDYGDSEGTDMDGADYEEALATDDEVTGDVTLNEDDTYGDASLFGEGPDENMDRAQQWIARAEAVTTGDLQDQRDLDDDLPEANEYEHTDTEIEDITQENLHDSSFDASRRSAGSPSNQRIQNFGPFGSHTMGARRVVATPAFNADRRRLRGSIDGNGTNAGRPSATDTSRMQSSSRPRWERRRR